MTPAPLAVSTGAFAEQAAAMRTYVEGLQAQICTAVEALEPTARFRSDHWTREGGGGGHTRVLERGAVFEKGAVNSSAVYGELTESFAQKLPGDGRHFFAAGVSLILHPQNPFAPTVHANYRFICHGQKAWVGGGGDLTPHYLFDEDARHFHQVHRAACERIGPGLYERFKQRCDEYFFLKHRGETRGVGGLFFEDPAGLDLTAQQALARSCGDAFVEAYLPIVQRRKDLPFGPEHKRWQELRRGRYVEFNLLYDRGTLFGLETNGRVESILVSMPPVVRFDYDVQPPGPEEARLIEVLRAPRSWA